MIEARPAPPKNRRTIEDPWWIRTGLLFVAISFLVIFLLVPLITVFFAALQKGLGSYFATFSDPAAFAAIQLTLLVAAIAVPANLIFGVSAAWAIAKFDFPGKSLLITLIDLPFAVSLHPDICVEVTSATVLTFVLAFLSLGQRCHSNIPKSADLDVVYINR